jgi:hypothetical protein
VITLSVIWKKEREMRKVVSLLDDKQRQALREVLDFGIAMCSADWPWNFSKLLRTCRLVREASVFAGVNFRSPLSADQLTFRRSNR